MEHLVVKDTGARPPQIFVHRFKHAAYHGEIIMVGFGYDSVHVSLLSGPVKFNYLQECETSSMVSQHNCQNAETVDTGPYALTPPHCHSLEAEALCIATAPDQSVVVAFLAERDVDAHGTYPLYCPNHGEWDLRDAEAALARRRSPEADLAGEGKSTWVTPLYANAQWGRGEETYTKVMRLLLDTEPKLCNSIYQGLTPLAKTCIGNPSGAARMLPDTNSFKTTDR